MRPDPTFESQRPRLFGLAYRLLGSRSDAEDVLQDAWLRYWAVARRGLGLQSRIGTVNGEPAILRFIGTQLHSAVLVVIGGERIAEVLALMNPDKLQALSAQR